GLHIALNPSPIDATIATLPLEKIKYFIVNEIEGAQICGAKTNETIIPLMTKKYPHASILLTLGADGAMYFDGQKTYSQPIFKVKAVDTTAAGDTFLGYFINGLLNKLPIPKILEIAAKAASITVSHKGAAQSIPTIDTVLSALNQ
ncbi:MAG: PfkB family carbohydrate kinase, partial [Christensenellaceae bacterium]